LSKHNIVTTLFSLQTTWTEYKHSYELELMQLLHLDG